MAKRFFVIEEDNCPECGGTGWITHPVWERYHEEHPDRGSEPDEDWFARAGYGLPPDEEILCHECDGEGVVRREVNLVDALEHLERNDG